MISKAVILGGGGFLGTHLTNKLLLEGVDVVSIGRNPIVGRNSHIVADLFELDSLDILLKGADVCIHLVTSVVPSSAERGGYAELEKNLALAFRIAESCRKTNVCKLIFASSGGTVYGQDAMGANEECACKPIGLYGVQKLAIESTLRSCLRNTSCHLVNLRIGNPYGLGQEGKKAHGIIGHILNSIETGLPFSVWGDGSQVRDYIYISDVMDAFFQSILYSGEKDVFNIGTGIGVSTNELIGICQEVLGKKVSVIYEKHPEYDVNRVSLDIGNAQSELEWQPIVGLREGIGMYYREWLKKNYERK
ncbi:NAD-dependent epimerase/dehydratase family protein [Lysobacter pythonis]|uniref:UDP-glucose 4-epimerase n=1 Tax=Solilutibacter pythonis TaxID=2483112 RepID=A0A3M2HZM5_9GAMM|nr:NAD-dependent epimerase/dehydratase family protein [Lysobacter pythonis]RMH93343.1 NAD-dependent epimerase/dehydratase family protein [Lysobacter pythonis]